MSHPCEPGELGVARILTWEELDSLVGPALCFPLKLSGEVASLRKQRLSGKCPRRRNRGTRRGGCLKTLMQCRVSRMMAETTGTRYWLGTRINKTSCT